MRVEQRAILLARRHFENLGHQVVDVSHDRSHKGYDFLVTRDGDTQRVEVKGCSRAWHIPDLFSTEFDADRRLVADFLCVVYFVENQTPWICMIPRDAIPPELVVPKSGFRISSRFKKESVLGAYAAPLSVDEDA